MPRLRGVSKSGHEVGEIISIGQDSEVPFGMLRCDGSAVSRTTFADLFTKIGTTWGDGDGATTFNIPDGRGRVFRGRDAGAGRDPDAALRVANATGGATGLCDKSLNVNGDEIWYGMFATHTSKKGKSTLRASP